MTHSLLRENSRGSDNPEPFVSVIEHLEEDGDSLEIN
jgi:hypothetical protein